MNTISDDDGRSIKKAASICRAIKHKLRQQIFNFICDGEKDVTNIYVHFRLEQSVASQHLAILRKTGWVTTRRDGKYIYYSANVERSVLYLTLFNKM